MGKLSKPLERRLDALKGKLARLPVPPDPQQEAEQQRRWERVMAAYDRGDRQPPDSDPETLSYWETLVDFGPAIEEMIQEGILSSPEETEV